MKRKHKEITPDPFGGKNEEKEIENKKKRQKVQDLQEEEKTDFLKFVQTEFEKKAEWVAKGVFPKIEKETIEGFESEINFFELSVEGGEKITLFDISKFSFDNKLKNQLGNVIKKVDRKNSTEKEYYRFPKRDVYEHESSYRAIILGTRDFLDTLVSTVRRIKRKNKLSTEKSLKKKIEALQKSNKRKDEKIKKLELAIKEKNKEL